MRRLLSLPLAMLAGCPGPAATAPPTVPDAGDGETAGSMIVAAPETTLWSWSGGTGQVRATVHQGVRVTVMDEEGGWVRIATSGKIRVEGWARSDDLGCRVASETPLEDGPDGRDAGGAPVARPGCTVRVLARSGGWLHVETAPEPFTYYEKGSGTKEPVVTHTEFAGFIAEGWIPAGACLVNVGPFFPHAPGDGELQVIKEPGPVLSSPGGLSNQIPGKALRWTRWVTMEVDGTWIRGRTDGQVVVEGWVPVTAVGPLPNTNPLNKLAEKKLKDFEVIAATGIKDSKGHEIATLPGGQEISKIDEDVRGCQVRTTPPVEVVGWVDCKSLRSLSVLPEAAIEYGVIDGGAWPPDRGPLPNPLPPWPESVEDEVEKQ
jgi:hypothetical protein